MQLPSSRLYPLQSRRVSKASPSIQGVRVSGTYWPQVVFIVNPVMSYLANAVYTHSTAHFRFSFLWTLDDSKLCKLVASLFEGVRNVDLWSNLQAWVWSFVNHFISMYMYKSSWESVLNGSTVCINEVCQIRLHRSAMNIICGPWCKYVSAMNIIISKVLWLLLLQDWLAEESEGNCECFKV